MDFNSHGLVELLDKFTKEFCLDKSIEDDFVYRCKECPFESIDGKCLMKVFKREYCPDYKDFGPIGDS